MLSRQNKTTAMAAAANGNKRRQDRRKRSRAPNRKSYVSPVRHCTASASLRDDAAPTLVLPAARFYSARPIGGAENHHWLQWRIQIGPERRSFPSEKC